MFWMDINGFVMNYFISMTNALISIQIDYIIILFPFLLHLFWIKWDFSVTDCLLTLLAEGDSELLPCGHLAHVRLLAMFSGMLKVSDSPFWLQE